MDGWLVATHYAGISLMGLTKNPSLMVNGRAERNGRYMAAFDAHHCWLEVALRYRQYAELQKLMDDEDEGLIFDVVITGSDVVITKVEDAATSAHVSA